jgi:surface antigen
LRVLVTAVAALLLLPVLAGSQSLGSAARKEAKRRSQAPQSSAKVYENADLSSVGTPPAQPESDVAPNPEGAADGDVRQSLERAESERRQAESYWRQRARLARARIAEAQSNYDFVCAGGTLLTGG